MSLCTLRGALNYILHGVLGLLGEPRVDVGQRVLMQLRQPMIKRAARCLATLRDIHCFRAVCTTCGA